jgi:4'-phosphopantetheinyl transferase
MSVSVEILNVSEAAKYRSFLSTEERARSASIVQETAKARFDLGRGLRRRMLAEAKGVDPDELLFAEDVNGKPCVANPAGWDFNVSHSGDYVAVVVGRGCVGIDIEMVRPVREAGSIVKRYFHPDEGMAWHTVAPGLREEAFFVLWSAREATMKCAGLGLARGLSVTRVDTAILADRQAAARVGDTRMDIRRLDAPNGYVAVVAQAAL